MVLCQKKKTNSAIFQDAIVAFLMMHFKPRFPITALMEEHSTVIWAILEVWALYFVAV